MGVYIKGMEMPTNCFDCPCVEAEFMECAAKEHLSLPKDEYGAALGEVPDWCPLVPIPKHGRLIDADTLLSRYKGNVWTAQTDYAEGLRDVAKDIADAPTIIPASEEGE